MDCFCFSLQHPHKSLLLLSLAVLAKHHSLLNGRRLLPSVRRYRPTRSSCRPAASALSTSTYPTRTQLQLRHLSLDYLPAFATRFKSRPSTPSELVQQVQPLTLQPPVNLSFLVFTFALLVAYFYFVLFSPAAAPSQVSPAPTTSSVGQTSLSLAWSTPVANGKPITGYAIMMQTGGTGVFNVYNANTASTLVTSAITGLSPGVQYAFEVAAINSIGTGSLSAASAIAVTAGIAVFFKLDCVM